MRQLLLLLFTVFALGVSLDKVVGQTISGGGHHSMALQADGTVVPWGSKEYGVTYVPDGLDNVVAISAGKRHSMALQADGTVVAWGDNWNWQCEVPDGLNDVVAISAGNTYSLALQANGIVVAWGESDQIVVPDGLNDVVAISAGNFHSLALQADGTVIAWASNLNSKIPVAMGEVVAIAAGSYHSLALQADGTVVAWGDNEEGQCNVPNGLSNVVAISAGNNYSLALKSEGTIVVWGSNYDGQCNIPRGLRDVKAISAGGHHLLALQADGTIVAWGVKGGGVCKVPRGLKAALPETMDSSFSNEPPILSINSSTIRFIDPNQNKALDAFEQAELKFDLSNTGPGVGRRISADVLITGSTDGINQTLNHSIPVIPSNETIEISIPIEASRMTQDGLIQITVELIEPKGFNPEPFTVEVETRAFRAPKLEVVDFSVPFETWQPNTPIGLDVLVQNRGVGVAENVEIELVLPKEVNCYSGNKTIKKSSLSPGETLNITYDMIVPRNFNKSDVQANLIVTEKYGDYGSTWERDFPFERANNKGGVMTIDAVVDGEFSSTERASLAKTNATPGEVSFNQIPKDVIVNTVAVLPIEGKNCRGETVNGQDIASFTEGQLLGLYNIVERRNLERVLDEQKLAMTGIIYEKSAVEAGCNVGAQGIIFTEYGCLTGQETIQLKLVDCQTSELYWSATGINATASEILNKVREELEAEKE